MKRFIAILCILATMVCFTACGKEYIVLEVGGYDCLSDAAHTSDWKAETKYYTDDTVDKNITIEWEGKSYDVTYEESVSGYLYNCNYHVYSKIQNGKDVQFCIDAKTGDIVKYSWGDVNYTTGITDNIKNRDECFAIAEEYFSDAVDDISEYVLVFEDYLEIPEYNALYTFKFARYINGVQTADTAYIDVTVYGKVAYHSYVDLGTMKNAKLPSNSEMKDIRKSVSKKLNQIYEPVKDKYNVTIGEEELLFMRLADGRYALQFTYKNLVDAKDGSFKGMHDQAKLIVFIE